MANYIPNITMEKPDIIKIFSLWINDVPATHASSIIWQWTNDWNKVIFYVDYFSILTPDSPRLVTFNLYDIRKHITYNGDVGLVAEPKEPGVQRISIRFNFLLNCAFDKQVLYNLITSQKFVFSQSISTLSQFVFHLGENIRFLEEDGVVIDYAPFFWAYKVLLCQGKGDSEEVLKMIRTTEDFSEVYCKLAKLGDVCLRQIKETYQKKYLQMFKMWGSNQK